MSASVKSLGLDRLSVEDRIALVEDIWDSIAEEKNVLPLTDTQRAELQRRIEEDDSSPGDVVSWSDVKVSTLGRLGK